MNWSPPAFRAKNWEKFEAILPESNLTNFFVSLFFYEKGKRISKNNIPDTFREIFKDDAQTNYNLFFNNLCDQAKIYALLKNYNTKKSSLDSALIDLLTDFKDLRVEQVNVLLFAVLRNYGDAILKTKEFLVFLKTLHTLIVRMQVCEKSMNKLDNKFSEYIDKMKTSSASLTEITNMMVSFGKVFVPDD